MPLPDATLTSQFKGLTIDAARVRGGSPWYEQASDQFHYGFSRAKGLWVAEIEPYTRCCHFSVKLFVFLRPDAKHRIKAVETQVCEVFLDGGFDELQAPFFPPDLATARRSIEQALTETSRLVLLGGLGVAP